MSLSLDTTGTAANNRVHGEQIPVTPASLATFGCLYLQEGPFFGSDFAISYTPAFPLDALTVPLLLGIDYDFKFELVGFGEEATSKVWGALNIYNQGLDGHITVSYQSLGGNWSFDEAKIKQYLNVTQYNSTYQFMALVNDGPLYLPNNPNAVWPLNSIQSITIAQAQMPSITLVVEFQRLGGQIDAPASVVVEALPLPPNAALENEGNLSVVAAAQGLAGTGLNPPTGGSGILGWLSGAYATLVPLLAAAQSIVNRLAAPFAVTQSGLWNVSLDAGGNAIGTTIDTALSEIHDSTTTAGVVYHCQAVPGALTNAAVWRIKRTTTASGRVEWAAGTGAFTQVADNRATLIYS